MNHSGSLVGRYIGGICILFQGHGAVWDKDFGRILVRFVDGFCKTDDATAKKLLRLGYKPVGESADGNAGKARGKTRKGAG